MEIKMLDFYVMGVAVDEQGRMPVVILQNPESKQVLPMYVGPFEASAIIVEIEGVHPPKPLTHDLFVELFQRHRFHLISVEIYGRVDDDYLAKIRYKTRVSTHTMDVRPSDGIALAIRLHAPILVSEHLLASRDTAMQFIQGAKDKEVLFLETQKPGIQLM